MEINKEEGRRKESVTFSSFSFALSQRPLREMSFVWSKSYLQRVNSGVHNTPLLCLTGPVSRKKNIYICKFK